MTTNQNSFLESAEPIAFYGLSRKGKGFAYDVLKAVRESQPDTPATAVHPSADDLPAANLPVARSAKDLSPPAGRAIVVLASKDAGAALEDAAAAGVKRVWLVMEACSKENRVRAKSLGVEVVDGCPLLFIPDQAFPHNFHRWLAKLFGKL
jgi:predicted CoA-binding protein